MKSLFINQLFFGLVLIFTIAGTVLAQPIEKFEKGRFVINPGDTIDLPKYPEEGKIYRFQGELNGLTIKLQLKKLNDSAIQYKLNIQFPNRKKVNEKGIMYLNKQFYLGSEERYCVSNDEMISCDNYFPKGEFMEICIGQSKDGELPPDKDPLFVQVQRKVAGEPEINLDNTPELIQLE